jgi:hypothetical protein
MDAEGPILRLAKQRIIAASADIEAQLSVTAGCRPVLFMLLKARDEAAEALAELATLPPGAPASELLRLQNDVCRYDDIVRWMRQLVARGFELDREISEAEREELADLLIGTPDGEEEAMELGLIEREHHYAS